MEPKNFMRGKLLLKHRIIIAVLAILIPVSIVFTGIIRGAIDQIETQLVRANMNSIQIYHKTLQTEIENAEIYLNNLVRNNKDFDRFIHSTTYSTDKEISESLMQGCEEFFKNNKDITAIALYNPKSTIYHARYNQIVGYESIRNEIDKMFQEKLNDKNDKPIGWFLMRVSERWLLSRIVEREHTYAVCFIDLTQAVRNAKLLYGLEGNVLFYKNDVVFTSEKWLKEKAVTLNYFGEDSYFSGTRREYIVVQKQLVGFKVALVVPFEKNKGGVKLLYSSSLVYFGVAALSLVVVVLYLERALFVTMDNLVVTMRKIQEGDLKARLGKYKGIEFKQVHETFNSMIQEITSLRIQSYEQQLMVKKSQMDALRMQIRPHFFLNCLKSIFGLAQAGNMEQIQKTVLCLSPHLRYVFDISADIITLEKELQMCENYISLQAACECGKPKCIFSIEDEILSLKVPPVSILTLVENCMKHGMRHDGSLLIKISAKTLKIDDTKLINIIIKDNGPGFSEKILEVLNEGNEAISEGRYVGLWNVARRFKLVYGEECIFIFANNNGAQIEIMFSIKEDEIHETLNRR